MFAINNKLDPKNEQDAEKVCELTDIKLEYKNGVQHTYINNKDYNKIIENYASSKASSDISKHKCVRVKLLNLQRDIAKKYNIIMEGRDIGSVVLKDADFKFFFDLDAKIRAERRMKDLKLAGETITMEELIKDIVARDKQDSTRAISPLVKADDAIVVDCSKTPEEIVAFMINIIYKKVAKC